MKVNMKANLQSLLNRTKLGLKKNAPVILTGVSAVTMVATVISACKDSRTREADDLVADHIDELTRAENSEKKVRGKRILNVYMKTGKRVLRVYRRTIILGVTSLAAQGAATGIGKKMYVNATASCVAMERILKNYREGVRERYGEDVDKELLYGIKEEEVEVKKKNKDGKEVVKKKKTKAYDPNRLSPFARFYEPDCLGWNKDPQVNKKFLMYQQKELTRLLERRGEGGWVTINEVYKALGMEQVPEGNEVGWVYSKYYPVGDNYIDFGIFNKDSEANIRFVNGLEAHILLDFNYDGNIIAKVNEYKSLKRQGGKTHENQR